MFENMFNGSLFLMTASASPRPSIGMKGGKLRARKDERKED
jgi:hypothetical protein